MYPWIEKMISDVPDAWSPMFGPAKPGERLLGKVPGDIYKAVLAANYAVEDATNRLEAHAKTHTDGGGHSAAECSAHHASVMQQATRAEILGNIMDQAILDHFSLPYGSRTVFRDEGVVLIEAHPMSALTDFLSKHGVGFELLTLGPNGPEVLASNRPRSRR